MNTILTLENVSKNFGGVQALHKCSFEVKEGIITSLIGPNGAGKTTAFNIINGFEKPDEGKVLLKNKDITGKQPHVIAALAFSRTFQMPRLFDYLSIEENLLLALEEPGEQLPKAFFVNRKPDPSEKKKLKAVLKEVGIDKPLDTLASELSYGQRKLLSLGRALLKTHNVILLDEPTAGVNPKIRQQLKDVLRKLRKQGKTILLIEHDMEFVMDLSDEIIVLDAGKKLMVGKPKEVKENPAVLEAYLGQ